MRSYEYCELQGERKTKLLTIEKISVYKDNKLLSLHSNLIQVADYMTITIISQKTEKENQLVFHHHSGHATLCSIKIWASIIKRILSYPGSSSSSKVNLVQLQDGSLHHLSNQFLLTKIHLAATLIRQDELGFSSKEIGLCSLQSGATMAIWCWSSKAFMDYICPQIAKLSALLSKSMISNLFHHPIKLRQ